MPRLPKATARELQLLREKVEGLLSSSSLSDDRLRAELDQLAGNALFSGLTALWGPVLYRRNPVFFRSFILARFSFAVPVNHRWDFVPWKEEAARLQAWLNEAERAGDVQIFRLLYAWRAMEIPNWQKRIEAWRRDLAAAWKRASSPAERARVLELYTMSGSLDQPTALLLYRVAPGLAVPFILSHLPSLWFFGEQRELWADLAQEALRRSDERLYFELYRRQVPIQVWEAELPLLCQKHTDPDELVAQLEKRHPNGYLLDLGAGFYRLLELRGRDVFPYLIQHLDDVRQFAWRPLNKTNWFARLRDLAAAREWWDLWAALLRKCARDNEYNDAVLTLVRSTLPEATVRARLLMLSGVGREFNFGRWSFASVQMLTDETALTLYKRFPDLVRGPFKTQVSVSSWAPFPRLTAAAIRAGDESLTDFLASRALTHDVSASWCRKLVPTVEQLSAAYERLRASGDESEFARRAASVLEQVPAYAVWRYERLVHGNRLARLLMERSHSLFLARPHHLRDLLESPSIFVQDLAWRILGSDDPRARAAAAVSLPHLLATLLRPLHRSTRLHAFAALRNAAFHGPEEGRRVVERIRQALDLPEKRYPREALIGLIGHILARYPELRDPAEQRVVHRREKAYA